MPCWFSSVITYLNQTWQLNIPYLCKNMYCKYVDELWISVETSVDGRFSSLPRLMTPESVGYVANQLVKHHPNRPSHCSVAPGPEGDYPESMRQKCGERLPEFTKEERGRQRDIPIWNGQSYAGWWFGTWILFSHILGIISPTGPTDFHIFQRGGSTTNQLCLMHWIWKILLKMGETFPHGFWMFLGHWLGQVFGSLDSNLGNETSRWIANWTYGEPNTYSRTVLSWCYRWPKLL